MDYIKIISLPILKIFFLNSLTDRKSSLLRSSSNFAVFNSQTTRLSQGQTQTQLQQPPHSPRARTRARSAVPMALLPGSCPRKRSFPIIAFCLRQGINFKGMVRCCAWGNWHSWFVISLSTMEKPYFLGSAAAPCTDGCVLHPRCQPESDPFVWECFLLKPHLCPSWACKQI